MSPSRGPLRSARSDRHFLAILFLAFAFTRALVYALGVRSSQELPAMHLLDRDLLASDLLPSLFLLHSQPPLFNALVGLVVKLGGEDFSLAMSAVYWSFGLAMTWLMFHLQRRLGVNAIAAAFVTLLFIVGPACLLYETYTMYTYPTAVLLLALAAVAHRFFADAARGALVATALLIAAVALTRSLFHLLWVVAAVVVVAGLRRPRRRQALVLALPVVLVGGLYLKNAVLFGPFGGSSLVGLNLYRISTELLPPEERWREAEAGELSPFALFPVNQAIDRYPLGLPERGLREVGGLDLADRNAWAFLPLGWSKEVEGSVEGPSLWSRGPVSVFVLPGPSAAAHTLALRWAPFEYPGAPPQRVEVRVNGHEVARLGVPAGVSQPRLDLPAGALDRPLNLLSFRYAATAAPVDVGLGPDSRQLAVRWLGFQLEPAIRLPAVASGSEQLRSLLERQGATGRIVRRDGGPNLNHWLMARVMQEYERDAWRVIRHHPRLYLRAVLRAGLIFLAPPAEHPTFRVKRQAIAGWERLYSRFVYGAPDASWPGTHSHRSRWLPTRDLLGRVSWLWLGLVLALLPAAAWRALRQPREPAHSTLLFILFNVLYVAVVANLGEYGENNRFRMMIEPLVWVALAAAAQQGIERLRARRAPVR